MHRRTEYTRVLFSFVNDMALIWIVVLLFILLLYKGTKKPKKFPPGPPRLPVVGSLPYIASRSKPSEAKSLLTGIRKGKNYYDQTTYPSVILTYISIQ